MVWSLPACGLHGSTWGEHAQALGVDGLGPRVWGGARAGTFSKHFQDFKEKCLGEKHYFEETIKFQIFLKENTATQRRQGLRRWRPAAPPEQGPCAGCTPGTCAPQRADTHAETGELSNKAMFLETESFSLSRG